MLFAAAAMGQAPSGVQVTGAEMESWFAADQMAAVGIAIANGCHWITKGPLDPRSQTLHCPGAASFIVMGVARIQDDQLCSSFSYPDGNKFEACQELYRVGENKYEARVNGVVRNVMYRLIR
ncbi:MAG: hypothetical protein MUF03_01050 [Rubrivivax sp.]|nr:hypothetical protein [Rubrivivax sp.]